jgi:two-component system, sporulation sensor kinase E
MKGGLKWLERTFKAVMDVRGTMTTIFNVERDISQRILAARDGQESGRRLADIVNFLPDATFVIDKEGKVIAWNLSMEEMTDVRAEEWCGQGRPCLCGAPLRDEEAHAYRSGTPGG